MDLSVLLYLANDGLMNGAIYALLAVSIVVLFSVTRIIFVPQGEFISFGALTFATLQDGQTPGTIYLLAGIVVLHALMDFVRDVRNAGPKQLVASAVRTTAVPLAIVVLAYFGSQPEMPVWVHALLSVAVVGAAGPSMYRITYQPIAGASILVLLIVSVALHFVMTGLLLYSFGPSGLPSAPLISGSFDLAGVPISYQSILIMVVTLVLIAGLFLVSQKTLYGKAMMAVSVNRTGARLMGISAPLAGRISFTLAATIGAISGVLIAPTTTILYDTGFVLGLKGFVGAILGGLASYPLAGAGALIIGVLDSYASFFASMYKEVIVFGLIIPILLFRSVMTRESVEDEVHESELHALPAMGERELRVKRILVSVLTLGVVAAMLAAPAVISEYWVSLLNFIGMASIVVLGLTVLTGVAGLTSFAQAAFMGVGAYVTGYLCTVHGQSPWLTLPLALLVGAALAYLAALITVRLSGHYLPLATLALAIVAFYLFGNLAIIGGQSGMTEIPPLSLFGHDLVTPKSVYYIIWAAVLVLVIALYNLLDSRSGRAMRALRYGTQLAESVAIDTRAMKTASFVIACLLAALAGWFYAHTQRFINPSPFSFNQGIMYLFMVVIGGAGNLIAAIVGAVIVVLGNQWLQTNLPSLLGVQGDFAAVVFGAIAIVMLQWLPAGIWPTLVNWSGMQLSRKWPAFGDAARLPERAKPGAGTPILTVDNCTKRFGQLLANSNVSLEVKACEILALIGPNGAGKSTLFDLISGAQQPSSGRIEFMGATSNYSLRGFSLLGMGRTFQHTRLVHDMSALENAAMGAHARGASGIVRASLRLQRDEEKSFLAEAERQLQRVGLGAFASHTAGSLALGQQRMLEIARALCADPVLLLLDEPAAGLRHLEKQALARLLRQLKSEGITVIIVEHDMDFVMNIADRIVVMQHGQKIAEGSPSQIQRDPAVIEAYLGGSE